MPKKKPKPRPYRSLRISDVIAKLQAIQDANGDIPVSVNMQVGDNKYAVSMDVEEVERFCVSGRWMSAEIRCAQTLYG